MKNSPVIAIDFDNTIASYDQLLYSLAVSRDLISQSVGESKSEIRDSVRGLPGGEILWQQLQATAYGPSINNAQLIQGVQEFLENCSKTNCQVYIVSHKTEYAAQDETQVNLRTAALNWMDKHQFFGSEGLGLKKEDVFFEDTRQKKIDRVSQLNCSHLIDDLQETFLEPGISPKLEKILFAPDGTQLTIPGVKSAKSWREITAYVFGTIK